MCEVTFALIRGCGFHASVHSWGVVAILGQSAVETLDLVQFVKNGVNVGTFPL